MKKKQILWIAIISIFSMISLVILQINWVKNAADLREEQLNHRVSMAMFRVIDQFSKDQGACDALSNSLPDIDSDNWKGIVIDNCEREKLDSLLQGEFDYAQVPLNYEFAIFHRESSESKKILKSNPHFSQTNYKSCLDNVVSKSGWELRVYFADKQYFIFSQMGFMLLASVALIVLLTACFVFTILTIIKQKKLSQMTTDFINNMTHEFKTPIATISLASNMLKKSKIIDKPDKIAHYSTIIHQENIKLQSQVERVLQLAKLERGEIKLNIHQLDIHKALNSAIESIELQVKNKKGQIDCQFDTIQKPIMGDEIHLRNIFSNLLDNANKYSEEKPQISIKTKSEKEGVLISIQDKGIGMSKDKQKHIFEKFYRVSTGNLHNIKGFGLGLAYVKMMVDAHKGSIRLDSDLGKGSKFEVFLPYSF